MELFIASTAKDNVAKEYIEESKKLIEKIACLPNINLVFGAFDKGLMQISYEEFKKNNKKITGVLTEYHQKNYSLKQTYTKKIVTKTTTDRFKEIYAKSDVLLILPGGLGTLAELFSAIEEKRINNSKKIILFNANYYFTPLIKELYHMYELGFIDQVPADYMEIESEITKIINIIEKEI